ncbi:MAG: hypothetical protein ACR2OH_06720 [Microthrixaceae bacterium]
MDTSAELLTESRPEVLFGEIEALDSYPEWLDIVPRVASVSEDQGDPGPAWMVELRGQLGPLRRSKRLRMVRSVHEPERRVRFIRREVDGRSHSDWTLTAEVTPTDSGSALRMSLHYGGNLWVPMLERTLREEIERSRPRLLERLVSGA